MSVAIIQPSTLRGVVDLPPSKSHTMRALSLAAMAHGPSMVHKPLFSPDTDAMIRVLHALGVRVTPGVEAFTVDGVGGHIEDLVDTMIDVGNSGLALRFGTALCALSRDPVVMTGDSSIQHLRSIEPLVGALRKLGAAASFLSRPGFAPIRVQGPIHAGCCTVDGRDSQPVSALLLTLPFVDGYSLISVEQMGEKPWLAMTLSALRKKGIRIERRQESVFGIPGGQRIGGFSTTVPQDASALAFPLIAALMTDASVEIRGVPFDDVQPDIAIVDYVRRMGGEVICNADRLLVCGPQRLRGVDIDINDAVDALPALAVLATKASGSTRLYNGAVCRHKESDRIHAMAQALGQMGGQVTEHPDGLTISESRLHGGSVSCYADHRVAMALIAAGLCATGKTEVHGVECVNKSFPCYIASLQRLGGRVETLP